MDNKKTISDVLKQAFSRESFIYLMRNLLNYIEIGDKHDSGNLIPEAYREHINQYWSVHELPSEILLSIDLKNLKKSIH